MTILEQPHLVRDSKYGRLKSQDCTADQSRLKKHVWLIFVFVLPALSVLTDLLIKMLVFVVDT